MDGKQKDKYYPKLIPLPKDDEIAKHLKNIISDPNHLDSLMNGTLKSFLYY